MVATAHHQTPVVEELLDGACLTTAALAELTGLTNHSVAQACSKLVSRGWIVRRERGCFELSERGRKAHEAGETVTSGSHSPRTEAKPRRPRRRTGRDKMWSAMRTLRKFALTDLETMSGASRCDAQRYTCVLALAGYLGRLRSEPGTAPTSNGFHRYLLIRPSGPDAPIYRAKLREVFDPNSGEVFKLGEAS